MRTPRAWWRHRKALQRARGYRAMVDVGAMSRDEVRESIGLPPAAEAPAPDGWLTLSGDWPPAEGQEIRFTYRTSTGREITCDGRYEGGVIWHRTVEGMVLVRRTERIASWCDLVLAELIDDEIVRQLTALVRDTPAVQAALEEIRAAG